MVDDAAGQGNPPTPAQTTTPRSPALTTGPGRALTFLYGLLAVAATGRSAFQLSTKFHDAPTAYVLSGVAAVIYIAAFVAIIRQERTIAIVACTIELAGVQFVGTWSLLAPHEFRDTTVWSGYGIGYGCLPAVLPILALLWLRRAPSYAPTARR